MCARPEIQRRGVDFVYEGGRKPYASEIDALEVTLARVASFNSNMIEFRRMKVSELGWVFLAAICAHDAAKFPR